MSTIRRRFKYSMFLCPRFASFCFKSVFRHDFHVISFLFGSFCTWFYLCTLKVFKTKMKTEYSKKQFKKSCHLVSALIVLKILYYFQGRALSYTLLHLELLTLLAEGQKDDAPTTCVCPGGTEYTESCTAGLPVPILPPCGLVSHCTLQQVKLGFCTEMREMFNFF